MWELCESCYGTPRGWDEFDDGFFIGTESVPECGDGCCWNRVECEECRGAGIEWHEPKP